MLMPVPALLPDAADRLAAVHELAVEIPPRVADVLSRPAQALARIPDSLPRMAQPVHKARLFLADAGVDLALGDLLRRLALNALRLLALPRQLREPVQIAPDRRGVVLDSFLRALLRHLPETFLRSLLELRDEIQQLVLRLAFADGIPEAGDFGNIRLLALLEIRPDIVQHLVGVRSSRILRAGNGAAVRGVQVQNNLAPLFADEIGQRVKLCLSGHDGKVDAAALRRNADVSLGHKLHHTAAVIPAAVVLAQSVADVAMIHGPVAAGTSLMPAGKVQPLAVRCDISGLRPLVSAPEVVDRILDVLPLFLSGVFADRVLFLYVLAI